MNLRYDKYRIVWRDLLSTVLRQQLNYNTAGAERSPCSETNNPRSCLHGIDGSLARAFVHPFRPLQQLTTPLHWSAAASCPLLTHPDHMALRPLPSAGTEPTSRFVVSLAKSENNSWSGKEESMKGEKNTCTRQPNEWVFGFTRQAWIPFAFGEWLSINLSIKQFINQ